VAATFLAAAAMGVVARPLVGRWADRLGLREALRVLLLTSAPLTVLLALITNRWLFAVAVACAVTSYGVLWGPAMARASSEYEEMGVAQVLGFSLMSLTSGLGLSVGAAAGGRIAQVAGDGTTYGLAAAACLATVAIPRFRGIEKTPR
jgi:predicted MFS family arabinose efflux permease